MDISFVGSAVGSSSPNTGTTLTLPGGMATEDFILVVAGVGDSADNGLAAPTEGGYTDPLGAGDLYANDTNDCNLDLFYKYHNGTDTTVSFGAVGGTNASNAAVVMVFRGVRLVTDGGPFDVTTTTATGIDTSNADPPSIDHSGAAGIWTVIAAVTGHTGGATAAFTFPTGYTTNAAQRAHNDTFDVLVGMGYKTAPTDPENPGALTAANIGTASANSWCAVTIALLPVAPVSINTNDLTISVTDSVSAEIVTPVSELLISEFEDVTLVEETPSPFMLLSISSGDTVTLSEDVTIILGQLIISVLDTATVVEATTVSLTGGESTSMPSHGSLMLVGSA